MLFFFFCFLGLELESIYIMYFDWVLYLVLKLHILENPKLSSNLGFINLIIIKLKAFRQENQKASQKIFHNHYYLDEYVGIDDWKFILFEQCKTWKLFIYWALLKKRSTYIILSIIYLFTVICLIIYVYIYDRVAFVIRFQDNVFSCLSCFFIV